MKRFYIITLFIPCIACSFVKQNGSQFIVHQDKVANFAAYNPTKNSLIKNLGYPSLELDQKTWLYYYYKTKNFNFLPKKIEEEAILLVYFNKKDEIINHHYIERSKPGGSGSIKINDEKNNKNAPSVADSK
jgi:outer membrane protein assembly factor BamE (lipoprotein component of BamABCDE complex)